MKVRAQVTLDNFGCFAVVVLTVAIHWVLAVRFGAHGFFGGFLAWFVAIGAALWIAGAAQARTRRLARRAFAAAACPHCGRVIGPEAVDAIVRDAERRTAEASPPPGPRRARPPFVTHWSGACPACHARIVFDPETRTLTH
jgi:hypothetical protein